MLTPDRLFTIHNKVPKLSLIISDDPFLTYWCEQILRQFCLKNSTQPAKQITFTDNWSDLLSQIQLKDLFSQPSACIVRIDKPAQIKNFTMQDLIVASEKSACPVILCFGPVSPQQQKSKWFSTLSQHATLIQTKSMQEKPLLAWANKLFAFYKLPISTQLLQTLCEHADFDPICLDQCVRQLALLDLENDITLEQAKPYLMASPNQSPAFTAVDMILNGNLNDYHQRFSSTLTTLDQTHAIYWLLIKRLRTFLCIAEQSAHGQTPLPTLFNQAKIWPKQQAIVKKCLRIPRAKLYRFYRDLCQLELALKGQVDMAFQPEFHKVSCALCACIGHKT